MTSPDSALIGLRDRALISVMVYTFARINAVLKMKVSDYFVEGRRGWVRLHEKGGKRRTRCPATTISKSTWMSISLLSALPHPDGPIIPHGGGRRPAS